MSTHSRRAFLMASAAAAPMINFGTYAIADSAKKYSTRVVKLVERSLVIDMLGVLKLDFSSAAWSKPLTASAAEAFRRSGVNVLHHSIGYGDPDAYAQVLQHFAAWNGFLARNPELFQLVNGIADIERARAAGRIAVIMGVQNSEHFRTLDDVQSFYDLGQRCSQLTYNSMNAFGVGSTERVDGGLSDAGAELIQRMNQLGMLVDVSHCGERTTLDAIEVAPGPIAITHSNCRALNDHPRLKTDEAIVRLAAKGGVMGVTGVRNFVRDREPTTVEHIVDHIDHVVKVAGMEHVGIGTDADLDGADDMPADQLKAARAAYKSSYVWRDKLDTDGFDDPLRFYNLTDALVRRGYSDANIEAILGGNFRRLLAAVWRAAGA